MTRHEANETEGPSLADRIRSEAKASGLSVYRLAIEAGVDQSTLNKFLNGDRNNLRLDMADRLCRVLGLRLIHDRKRAASKKAPGGSESDDNGSTRPKT